jgi:glycosyltransferase involved in cell wall biosynthesis
MKIMLIADGRSPITMRFAEGLHLEGIELALLSTYPCQTNEMLFQKQNTVAVAFGQYSGSQVLTTSDKPEVTDSGINRRKKIISRFRNSMQLARYWLGPLTLARSAASLQDMVNEFQPDLVHALRIPFEGMLGAHTPASIPFIASIWGNDLTLHALGSSAMQKWTLRTLQRADGLAADTRRDIRLAQTWGYPHKSPQAVFPGNGGIDLNEIQKATPQMANELLAGWLTPEDTLIINPRGFRPGSVRNDVFFEAVRLLVKRLKNVRFVCPAMANQIEAQEWVNAYGLHETVRLLPYLSQDMLWSLFKRADLSVSISEHDGTPNSLLEAMAIGCLPVAGDIESIREWIVPGVNGMLAEPYRADAVADAIAFGVENPQFRQSARAKNAQICQARVSRSVVIPQILEFYEKVIKEKHRHR